MRDASKRSLVYRINRNILECKENNIFVTFIFCHVLIETYWNVKVLSAGGSGAQTGINRNILECKVRIDWNAKIVKQSISKRQTTRLAGSAHL